MVSLSADLTFSFLCITFVTRLLQYLSNPFHSGIIKLRGFVFPIVLVLFPLSWKIGGRLSDKIRSLGIQIQSLGRVTGVSELE